MELTFILPVVESAVFGLVVAGVYYLILPASPFPVRQWLASAWVLACLCYIVLFGLIKA